MRLRSKEEIEGEEDREGKRITVLVRLDARTNFYELFQNKSAFRHKTSKTNGPIQHSYKS